MQTKMLLGFHAVALAGKLAGTAPPQTVGKVGGYKHCWQPRRVPLFPDSGLCVRNGMSCQGS